MASWSTFSDVADWAGLSGDIDNHETPRGSLAQALGIDAQTPLRAVGFIPEPLFGSTVDQWGIGMMSTMPTIIQRSTAMLVGHAARLACGTQKSAAQIQADTAAVVSLQLAQAQASVQPSSVVAAPVSTNDSNIQLDQVIDQGSHESCAALKSTDVDAAYDRWFKRMGDNPDPECEPSLEQLSTLHHLVQVRQGVPYADFSIFCPHALRLARKLKFVGMMLGPDGTLFRGEINGPQDVQQWEACFNVFKTAAVMLDIMVPSTLDAYCTCIRNYAKRYGDTCWPIIYQADTRARKELAARIRRKGQREYEAVQAVAASAGGTGAVTHEFDPSTPWKYVWKQLPLDFAFWRHELEDPCVLLIAKVVSPAATVDGSAITGESPAPSGQPSLVGDQRAAKRQKRGGGNPPPAQRLYNTGADGKWSTNRSGKPLCPDYQMGTCHGNYCSKNSAHVHQCAICLAPDHGSSGHAAAMSAKGEGKGKGKGKGKKGKGKGKGKSQW